MVEFVRISSLLNETNFDNKKLLRRVCRQFGDLEIPEDVFQRLCQNNLGKAEVFRLLTAGHGTIKPHCSQQVCSPRGHLYDGALRGS